MPAHVSGPFNPSVSLQTVRTSILGNGNYSDPLAILQPVNLGCQLLNGMENFMRHDTKECASCGAGQSYNCGHTKIKPPTPSPLDRLVHKDEFKLRILMTDGCNFNCPFCLNDFQPKPPRASATFLDTRAISLALRSYVYTQQNKYPLQVYFSGGEPTLHNSLVWAVNRAKDLGCRVTVNTNGSFLMGQEYALREVDCMHFGVYRKSENLASRIKRMNGSVQCVYSTQHPYVNFEFLEFYLSHGLPIKIFGDLKDPDTVAYEAFARSAVERFPSAELSFRFIGQQENRGVGCTNCDRYCVTLKGAWVFPDGGVSHCPQKCKGQVYYPETLVEWTSTLDLISKLHEVQING